MIFLTGQVNAESHKLHAFEIGAVEYLSRPVHGDELIARIRVMLRLREASQKLEAENLALTREVQQVYRDLDMAQSEVSDLRELADRSDHVDDLDVRPARRRGLRDAVRLGCERACSRRNGTTPRVARPRRSCALARRLVRKAGDAWIEIDGVAPLLRGRPGSRSPIRDRRRDDPGGAGRHERARDASGTSTRGASHSTRRRRSCHRDSVEYQMTDCIGTLDRDARGPPDGGPAAQRALDGADLWRDRDRQGDRRARAALRRSLQERDVHPDPLRCDLTEHHRE